MPPVAAAMTAPLSAATVTTLAPALIERWSQLLPLQRGESLLLALDLWARVSPQLTARRLAACGAARPFEAALAGCLWVAAKMEECRRGLPNATKVDLGMQSSCIAVACDLGMRTSSEARPARRSCTLGTAIKSFVL